MRQVRLRQLADLLPEPDMCKGCRGRHFEALPALAQHWEARGKGQSRWEASWPEGSSQEEAGHAAACAGAEKRQEAISIAKQLRMTNGVGALLKLTKHSRLGGLNDVPRLDAASGTHPDA